MKTYLRNLFNALLGRSVASPRYQSEVAGEAELRARVAALELDLRERDEQVAQMRREYSALEAARARAEAVGARGELEKLLRKLCGPLASLSTLAAAAKAGKDVRATDMADLVAELEKQLRSVGFSAIGQPGEQVVFDVAAHQRMSGGTVYAGSRVVVRLPGYRFGDKVLQKAMVTSSEVG